MRTIGMVTRLQIQRAHSTRRQAHAVYDPASPALGPGAQRHPEGALGASPMKRHVDRDVHHRAIRTRKRGRQHGISLGFTSHYDAMPATFRDKLEWMRGEHIGRPTAVCV